MKVVIRDYPENAAGRAVWLENIAKNLSEEFIYLQRINEWRQPYLYYRKTTKENYGALAVIPDGDNIPDGFVLGIPETLRYSRNQIFNNIRAAIKRFPIL